LQFRVEVGEAPDAYRHTVLAGDVAPGEALVKVFAVVQKLDLIDMQLGEEGIDLLLLVGYKLGAVGVEDIREVRFIDLEVEVVVAHFSTSLSRSRGPWISVCRVTK
jgi:hypothetical protein